MFTSAFDESAAFFRCRGAEASVELVDVLAAKELIGFVDRGNTPKSQFLRYK
jgi:hypothetical protein